MLPEESQAGTPAENQSKVEDTPSSPDFGNAMLAAEGQDGDPGDLYYKYAVIYPSLKKLGYFSENSFSISKQSSNNSNIATLI